MTNTESQSIDIGEPLSLGTDYKSELNIGNGIIIAKSTHPFPNLWIRFWYKLLLGWVWKKLTP